MRLSRETISSRLSSWMLRPQKSSDGVLSTTWNGGRPTRPKTQRRTTRRLPQKKEWRQANPDKVKATDKRGKATATTEKRFYCKPCEAAFPNDNKPKRHLKGGEHAKKLAFLKNPGPWSCGVCKKSFTRLGGLNDHLKTKGGTSPRPLPLRRPKLLPPSLMPRWRTTRTTTKQNIWRAVFLPTSTTSSASRSATTTDSASSANKPVRRR